MNPVILALIAASVQQHSLEGSWRAVLDLAGGPLAFEIRIAREPAGLMASLCNGPLCDSRAAITQVGDSLQFDIADYAATISVARRGDSLAGAYRNVGNRGPRTIPFRASRGTWPRTYAGTELLGSWDAWLVTDGRRSPRVFEFRNGTEGLEAAFLANSGDYGLFWGGAVDDSFHVARFDGTFVYLLAGRQDGDTLRGIFHAGPRTQTPFVASRSSGAPHLVAPTALTTADTMNPFHFSFPDLEGRRVTEADSRLKARVVLVDIFGSWCSTCHDAMPDLLKFYRTYQARGLEIVGFGYEVSADSSDANRQIRRFRNKFGIPWLLLRSGINVVEETAASLPQLHGFTAYPTTLFLGRDGRIRQVYAGFRGPATGAQHTKQIADYREMIERLLREP